MFFQAYSEASLTSSTAIAGFCTLCQALRVCPASGVVFIHEMLLPYLCKHKVMMTFYSRAEKTC